MVERRRFRWRPVVRWVAWGGAALALLLVLLLVGGLAFLRSETGRGWLRGQLLAQARQVLPGLDLKRIGGDYLQTLALEGIELRDRFGTETLRLRRLSLAYDLRALLRRQVVVTQVVIEGLRLRVQPTERQQLNVAALLATADRETEQEPVSEGASSWTIDVGNVSLRDAAALLALDANEPPMRVEGLTLDGRLQLAAGQVDARLPSLVASVEGPPLSGQTPLRARVQASAAYVGSSVALTLRVAGKGILPEGRVALDLALLGSLQRLAVVLDAALPRLGGVRLLATAVPTAQLPDYWVLASLDGGRMDGGTAPLRNLVQVVGHGVPLQPGARSAVALQLARRRLWGYDLGPLQLRGRLEGAQWQIDRLRAAAAGATVRASGRGNLQRLQRAQLKVKVPELADLPGVKGAARGRVALDAELSGPLSGPWRARVAAEAKRVSASSAALGHLALEGDLKGLPYRPRGRAQIALQRLRLGQGAEALQVSQAQLQLEGKREQLHLDAQARGPQLLASIAASVVPGKQRTEVGLEAVQLRYRGLRVMLRNQPRLSLGPRGRIELTHSALTTLDGRVDVEGVYQSRVPARVQATVGLSEVSLRALAGLVPALATVPNLRGRLGGQATVWGSVQQPQLALSLRTRAARGAVRDLAAAARLQTSPDKSSLKLTARYDHTELVTLDAELGMGPVALAALAPRERLHRLLRTPLSLRLTVPSRDLHTLPRVVAEQARLVGTLQAGLQLQGTPLAPQGQLALSLNKAAVDGQPLGNLAIEGRFSEQQAKMHIKQDGMQLLDIEGTPPAGMVQRLATGAAVASEPLAAKARLPTLRLDRLLRGWGLEDVRGTVGAQATLSGSVSAPQVTGRVQLALDQYHGLRPVRVQLSGRYASGAIEGRMALHQRGGGWLKGRFASRSSSPADRAARAKAGRISGELEADGLDLRGAEGLLPGVRRVRGRLAAKLRIEGPVSALRPNGELSLDKGVLQLSGMPTYTAVNAQLRIDTRGVRLRKLVLQADAGSLRASGRLDWHHLRPQAFALDGKAHRLPLAFGPVRHTAYSGRISLRGRLLPSGLKGRLILDEGVVALPEIEGQDHLYPVGLPSELTFVESLAPSAAQRGAKKSAGKKKGLQFEVKTTPVFVRGKQADVEVASDLKVTTDDRGRPRVRGYVNVRRGWVEILERRYQVLRGMIRFNGAARPDPVLDIEIGRAFEDVRIVIAVSGTARHPEIDFRSDPAVYDRGQIVSLIVTGRSVPYQQGGGGGNWMETAQAMASQAITQALLGGLLNKVAGRVGLDVANLSLGQNGNESGRAGLRAEAELGKFLTERLYLGYRRIMGADVDENANEGLLEYRISARWLLNAEFGDAGVGKVDLLWNFHY